MTMIRMSELEILAYTLAILCDWIILGKRERRIYLRFFFQTCFIIVVYATDIMHNSYLPVQKLELFQSFALAMRKSYTCLQISRIQGYITILDKYMLLSFRWWCISIYTKLGPNGISLSYSEKIWQLIPTTHNLGELTLHTEHAYGHITLKTYRYC